MQTFLKYFELIVSILLIISILVQNRTAGLNAASGSTAAFQTTRRGAEKVVFNFTIILAVMFVLSSLAFLFVK